MNLTDIMTEFLALAKSSDCKRLCVAYSGGLDSQVLLVLLNSLNQGEDCIPLDAIYINHNLQKDSTKWGDHCRAVCKSLNIPFQQIDVDATPENGESPEEKARTVRYQALSADLQKDHWLLTAQHSEDQAETFLLQLMRGSGVDGLSAMPYRRQQCAGEHLRPLLKASKQQIKEYAAEQNLHWVDDPSNQDLTIVRNYLRNKVMPSLKNVWPESARMIERSAAWIAEAAEILADIAAQDLSVCRGHFQSLDLRELKKLSYTRQKNLLRHWFHSMGLKRPGSLKLKLIFEQIINARDDASPLLEWQGICLRRYQEHLYILPKWTKPEVNIQLSWDARSTISLSSANVLLTVAEVTGRGLKKSFQQQTLTLQFRKGGEVCCPVDRNHSRSLKKLFYEYSVPPWLRGSWPLLYCEDQLIAVPGLFVCKGFDAKPTEVGIEFSVDFGGI